MWRGIWPVGLRPRNQLHSGNSCTKRGPEYVHTVGGHRHPYQGALPLPSPLFSSLTLFSLPLRSSVRARYYEPTVILLTCTRNAPVHMQLPATQPSCPCRTTCCDMLLILPAPDPLNHLRLPRLYPLLLCSFSFSRFNFFSLCGSQRRGGFMAAASNPGWRSQ